ncbi:hypothetical protein B0H63DRAFT_480885 [Podospora didyma]|uniref:Fe2OG dioxygenase domain-containing protein n=1 Tax=Podospora didyma TaxID=330526 RepID=A0AAE0N9V5_9PEZI|nr:hypothetical protein B0H63DRAFT_480885 [Podospora didyma]
MATADVIFPSAAASTTWAPFEAKPMPQRDDGNFDPKKHLNFVPPSTVHTMADIGLPEAIGVAPLAVSEPFPLFTKDAVMRMREEVLSKDVTSNCVYSSNLAQAYLRGYADKYAPFVYNAWKSPETLNVISQVAGIDLSLQCDFEIGHINLSFKTEEQKNHEMQEYRHDCSQTKTNNNKINTPDDDAPIVGWHTDSYPFVCVVMLSDCTEMIGGETALRTGSGSVLKIRSPQMGHAIVLQGRYITHAALRSLNAVERITMVTSFRPRNPHARDDTVLTTVRPISHLPDLYYQFATYRLEMLAARVASQLKELADARAAGRTVATREIKRFLEEQERFVAHTNAEMVDEDEVVVGVLPQVV